MILFVDDSSPLTSSTNFTTERGNSSLGYTVFQAYKTLDFASSSFVEWSIGVQCVRYLSNDGSVVHDVITFKDLPDSESLDLRNFLGKEGMGVSGSVVVVHFLVVVMVEWLDGEEVLFLMVGVLVIVVVVATVPKDDWSRTDGVVGVVPTMWVAL